MYEHRSFLIAVIISAWAFAPGTPALAADSHQHAAGEPTTLTLDRGKKWPTDEPLRRHMSEIRAALDARHQGIHKGTLALADYTALGALIEARVASIVADCKLDPAADAQLHLIVAELVAAADAMQGKSKTKPANGALRAVQAINNYGRYFNHPGWKNIG